MAGVAELVSRLSSGEQTFLLPLHQSREDSGHVVAAVVRVRNIAAAMKNLAIGNSLLNMEHFATTDCPALLDPRPSDLIIDDMDPVVVVLTKRPSEADDAVEVEFGLETIGFNRAQGTEPAEREESLRNRQSTVTHRCVSFQETSVRVLPEERPQASIAILTYLNLKVNATQIPKNRLDLAVFFDLIFSLDPKPQTLFLKRSTNMLQKIPSLFFIFSRSYDSNCKSKHILYIFI